jgi:hypothetical protein
MPAGHIFKETDVTAGQMILVFSRVKTLRCSFCDWRLSVSKAVHPVSLPAGERSALVRKSVYGTIINLLQPLHTAWPEDSDSEIKQPTAACTLS